jgi:hypothetical protein
VNGKPIAILLSRYHLLLLSLVVKRESSPFTPRKALAFLPWRCFHKNLSGLSACLLYFPVLGIFTAKYYAKRLKCVRLCGGENNINIGVSYAEDCLVL